VATKKSNLQILEEILDWAKQKLTTEQITNKLLLATDDIGWTVWHVATKKGNIQILEEILDWAKE
jgi:hypothetical protein